MSELGAGSKVWVKVANATIWWPSTVISTSSANSDVILNDPFSRVGIDDLILVKFLGTFDESVDNRIAALKLSDRGSSWECIGPADHRSQIVPTSLRMLYDSAIFMLEGNENLNLTLNPSNRFDSISMETPVKGKNKQLEKEQQVLEEHSLASDRCIENRQKFPSSSSSSSSSSSETTTTTATPHKIFQEKVDPKSIQLLTNQCKIPLGGKVYKRENVVPWDDYFMSVAFLSAMRSKDPSTQVGACIVNTDKRIVGIGYNGFPRGCSDDELPWARVADDELDTKYPYVCHAEVNAILNKNSAEVRGCSIYVALFPCNDCAKIIIQSGISEVVYLSDKYKDSSSMRASRRMMNMAGVLLRQYTPTQPSILIDFSSINSS